MATVNTTVERIVLETIDKGGAASIKGITGALGGMRAGLDTINNALAAVGVTVGVGAMLTLAANINSATAALDDMAESTGGSVEGLSSLQRVARVGGHDFEGLTGVIGRMAKGLKDGGEEGSKAARALDFVGVKTKDLNGRWRDSTAILIDVARATGKYEDDLGKVQLIQDALGKGAERYLPFLKDIAKGTDLQATATARQAEEADRAEKNTRRLTLAMEDQKRLLVNEYTPAFNVWIEKLLAAQRASGGLAAGLLTMATADTASDMQARLQEIERQIDIHQSAIDANQQDRPGLGNKLISALRTPSDEASKIRIGRLMAERSYLEGLRANRMRAIGSELEGQEMDAGGNLQPVGKGRLNYNPADSGADAKALREAEFVAQKQVELEEMAAQDMREAQDAYTKYFRGVIEDRQHIVEEQADGSIRVTERVVVNLERQREIQDLNNQALIEAEDRRQEEAIIEGQEFLDLRANQLQAAYNLEYLTLLNAREQGFLTEQEYNERLVDLSIQHQERLTGITNTAYQQRQRFVQSSMTEQARTIFGEMANITSGVAQHNKALFRINQIAGISNAIINASTGISKTLAAYPYPWNIAMAALHGVAAFAQVQAISSAQYGGGGGSAPSLAGGTAATPVTPVSSGTPAQRGPDTFINISGSEGATFSTKQVRELLQRINEATRDGGRIVLSS